MPYKEYEIKKKYYSIGEVKEILEVKNTSFLRFWLKGLGIEVKRSRNQHKTRMFVWDEINMLRRLIKFHGLVTLRALREIHNDPLREYKIILLEKAFNL